MIYLSACIFGLMASAHTYPILERVNHTDFWIMSAAAVFVLIGQLLMTYGYKFVTPATGSLISFVTIPLTLVLSNAVGEEMTNRFFLGTFLIISGLLMNSGDFANSKTLS